MTCARGIVVTLLVALVLACWTSPARGDCHPVVEGPSYHWKKEPRQNNLNLGMSIECSWLGLRWNGGGYNNTAEELSLHATVGRSVYGRLGAFVGLVTNYEEGASDALAHKLRPTFFGGLNFMITPAWEVVHIPGAGGVTHLRAHLWEPLK